jgi:SecD/SecF fusion protein
MGLFVFSIVVVVSVISLATNKLDQGVDFVEEEHFKFENQLKGIVKEELTKVFGSAEVKIFGNDNQLKITTKYKVEEHGVEADQEVNKLLFESLKQHFCRFNI